MGNWPQILIPWHHNNLKNYWSYQIDIVELSGAPKWKLGPHIEPYLKINDFRLNNYLTLDCTKFSWKKSLPLDSNDMDFWSHIHIFWEKIKVQVVSSKHAGWMYMANKINLDPKWAARKSATAALSYYIICKLHVAHRCWFLPILNIVT